MVVNLESIVSLWPIIFFFLGMVWKIIITHFEVKELKENKLMHEKKIADLELEFEMALKDHILENRNSIDGLTEAVKDLVKTTTILATKIEVQEKQKH